MENAVGSLCNKARASLLIIRILLNLHLSGTSAHMGRRLKAAMQVGAIELNVYGQ